MRYEVKDDGAICPNFYVVDVVTHKVVAGPFRTRWAALIAASNLNDGK